jgi:hypothetical protein
MKLRRKALILAAGVAASASVGTAAVSAVAAPSDAHPGTPAVAQILTPRPGDVAGDNGKDWIVDLKVRYPSVEAAGFTTPQLTGPGVHNNAAPFPGSFSTGADEHLPGLVVLDSNSSASLPGFSGPGTNLANLFNVTALVDQNRHGVQIQDTWLIGAPFAGVDVDTTLTAAVVGDSNHDGVLNDAPAVVKDANDDGRVDVRDVKALGLAGPVQTVRFHIAGTA